MRTVRVDEQRPHPRGSWAVVVRPLRVAHERALSGRDVEGVERSRVDGGVGLAPADLHAGDHRLEVAGDVHGVEVVGHQAGIVGVRDDRQAMVPPEPLDEGGYPLDRVDALAPVGHVARDESLGVPLRAGMAELGEEGAPELDHGELVVVDVAGRVEAAGRLRPAPQEVGVAEVDPQLAEQGMGALVALLGAAGRVVDEGAEEVEQDDGHAFRSAQPAPTTTHGAVERTRNGCHTP